MATLKIDNYLKLYKLTQKDLVDGTGINKNTISKYCNNTFEKIDKRHIDLLCNFFKCTPNDLFSIDRNEYVKPAKILYYNDKTDDFTWGEIRESSPTYIPSSNNQDVRPQKDTSEEYKNYIQKMSSSLGFILKALQELPPELVDYAINKETGSLDNDKVREYVNKKKD